MSLFKTTANLCRPDAKIQRDRLLYSIATQVAIGAVWSNGNISKEQRAATEKLILERCSERFGEIVNEGILD